MKIRISTLATAICAVIAAELLLLPEPAQAYLDPGTGSLVLQMLVAGIVSALFTIKLYWRRVKAFTLGLFGKSAAVPENKESNSDSH